MPEEATRALGNYFSKSNLTALRELALRRAAQAIDAEMLDYLRAHALAGTWAAGERVLVAVSERPGASELVRTAKRIADALRGSWTAVHIETPRANHFSDADNARLAATLHLASQLGGQVATVPAETVAEGVMRFAAEARATQLIVGKSVRSRWFELRHGSVVDRLVRETHDLVIHVLPMDPEGSQRARHGVPAKGRWGRPLDYVAALGLVALVTLLGTALFSSGNITNVGLLFLLPVMVVASRYGLRVGIVTSLVSSLTYNFFFIPPTRTFTIQDPQNILTVLVLLGVAVASSQLAARVRDQALLAQRSAAQNSSLAGFARQLTGISQADELAQLLCGEVGRLLGVHTLLLLPEDGQLVLRAAVPPDARLEAIEQAASRWAFDHNQPAGRSSETLTASEWLFHPLAAGGRALGVFGLARPDAGTPIRSDQLPLLLSLLDQAALALERIALEAEMSTVTQLKERDRLRAPCCPRSATTCARAHHDPGGARGNQSGDRRARPPAQGSARRSRAAEPLRRQSARHGPDRDRRAATSRSSRSTWPKPSPPPCTTCAGCSAATASNWTCRPTCLWCRSIRSSSTIASSISSRMPPNMAAPTRRSPSRPDATGRSSYWRFSTKGPASRPARNSASSRRSHASKARIARAGPALALPSSRGSPRHGHHGQCREPAGPARR